MKLAILALSLFCSVAFAERAPLFFQADKNNIQVLPQKFEYGLIDENTTRLGDILIDVTQLKVQIVPDPGGPNSFRLKFNWPAGLLTEGKIILKDNIGKALVTADVNPRNVRVRKTSVKSENADENLRSELAEFQTTPLRPLVMEDISRVPFMVFCVFREEANTRIYLCSKEFYLAGYSSAIGKTSKPVFRDRVSSKRTAQVDINGQVVGNQGMIFLNEAKENLVFKSYSESGSILEIETRRRNVDFKDIVMNEAGTEILLRVSGTDPIQQNQAKKLDDGDWLLTIPVARPVFYLKGDGGIPMRQDFLIKGELPKEADRVFATSKVLPNTYRSSFTVSGEAPEGANLSAVDAESSVTSTDGKNFQWNLNALPKQKKTRRYIKSQRGNSVQVAGYDIYRALPFEVWAETDYQPLSGLIFAKAGFQWWFENFLAIDSAATNFKTGLSLEHSQHLNSKSNRAKLDVSQLELLYRFSPGFHLSDPSWGLLIPVRMAKVESESTTGFGLGLFTYQRAPNSLRNWMNWYSMKARYYLPSSASSFKIKQSYTIESKAYSLIGENLNLTYGVGLQSYQFDPAPPKQGVQLDLNLGISYLF